MGNSETELGYLLQTWRSYRQMAHLTSWKIGSMEFSERKKLYCLGSLLFNFYRNFKVLYALRISQVIQKVFEFSSDSTIAGSSSV